MPVAYPSTLPLPMFGHTREQPAAFTLAQPRRGWGYVEPTGTDVPVFWLVDWTLTEAQAKTFRQWFVATTERGTLPFTIGIRTEFGIVEHEVQFTPNELLSARHLGGGVWKYSATIMARDVIEFREWNANDKNVDIILSAGNRVASLTAPLLGAVRAITQRDAGGDRYFEVAFSGAADGRSLVGVATATHTLNTYPGSQSTGWSYFGNTGERYNNATPVPYGATWANDTIGVRLAAGVLSFYKNGVSQGPAFTGLTGVVYPVWGSATANAGTRSASINTGKTEFVGGLPAGSTAWG